MGARKSRIMLGFVVLGLLMFIILSSASESFKQLAISGGGYVSAFEGPKATFYGVKWNPNDVADRIYTSTANPGGSLCQFDAVMRWDADFSGTYMEGGIAQFSKPNIFGEMTTVYIPEQQNLFTSWVPMSWWNNQQNIVNPLHSYAWNVSGYVYNMSEYKLRQYISFAAGWEGQITIWGQLLGEIPPAQIGVVDNSYNNVKVCIRYDTEPTWYIEGQNRAYFAIAKVQLAEDAKFQSTTNAAGGVFDSNKGTSRPDAAIDPNQQLSPLYISYGPFGDGGAVETTPQYYLGKQLNPAYFRNTTYVNLDLTKFGLWSGNTIPGTMFGFWVKGDTVTIALDITVFVFGEWKVQDIQENPEHYGSFQRTAASDDIVGWLFSSSTLAWLIPVLIIAALFIFAPWFIFALMALFRG